MSLRGRGSVLSTWSYLCREEAKRSTETAGSDGDSRLSIGGNADRKSPARQKMNLESRAEEEAFTLNFYRRGREGAIRKGEERRVVLVVLRSRCISSSSSSSSSIWYKQIQSHVRKQEEEQTRERGNLTEGEGTLGRGEGNSAGRRSRHKLVQLGDILFDTHNQLRGGREEGEHLE